MIQALSGGMFGELTYLYIDDVTKHGFVIDPGVEGEKLVNYIKEQGFVIEKILLTHGHIDHISSAKEVRDALGASIVIHKEGKIYLEDPKWNLSMNYFEVPLTMEADEYVEHGDEIVLEANADFKVQVIYVPGHTADGVAYYSEKEGLAFVGDIIFEGSVGRSDLLGGNAVKLLDGIRKQIFSLPDETVLFPGHGNQTTVKKERETSPVFNFYDGM
ncbi:MAG: MBL fold metallo-hydrolase [Candidatus Cellulosilyticum pullistercoris]|uniref:MBL fold metallo-hydrolase n=1 Tax=Candidatus Cellulosilyticum pullistercoris TaxID=2838521 RepID=A0A9E2KC15_9FIRM|nr:MBL fold metallo-hydrolase [Candidatus Cellulosilyticum pullistercoris]